MDEIHFQFNNTEDGNVSLRAFFEVLEKYHSDNLFVYNRPENLVLIAIYIPVFLIALFSNILVIAVFIKYRTFRTITNCLLMNLSTADLLVTLICMPAAVGQAIHEWWIYGDFICKATHYLQGVAVSLSVFTLTVMSIDRYIAIRHPLRRKNFISKRIIIKVIFILWTISVLIFAPLLHVRKTVDYGLMTFDFIYCVEVWPNSLSQRIFGVILFTTVYAVPGLIILLAYSLMGSRLCQKQLLPGFENTPVGVSNNQNHQQQTDSSSIVLPSPQVFPQASSNLVKERRKVARTLMILALVFACCWLPSSLLDLILDLRAPESKSEMASTTYNEYFYKKLHQYFILLGHLNSLLNPLLYCLLTRNFRNHVRDCFKGRFRWICCLNYPTEMKYRRRNKPETFPLQTTNGESIMTQGCTALRE